MVIGLLTIVKEFKKSYRFDSLCRIHCNACYSLPCTIFSILRLYLIFVECLHAFFFFNIRTKIL